MFPPQTSFIPLQIALARYLENFGGRAVFSDYPFWYLGSTSFRWLTGPVVPGLLVFFHKILPQLSLFDIFFMLMAFIWPIGAAGVYVLVRFLWGKRSQAVFAAFLYFFGPIVPFLFQYSDGLYLLSFSLLPWALVSYANILRHSHQTLSVIPTNAGIYKNNYLYRFLVKPGMTKIFVCVFLTTIIFLTNTTIIPQVILGMVVVLISVHEWKNLEKELKKLLLIISVSLLISTFWYGPGFWWQIIFSSSFGGQPFYAVVNQLVKLLPVALAVALGIFGGKILKTKNTLAKFAFYWLFIFGFLTGLRFLSDPDYWLDWSAYGMELQMGMALLLTSVIARSRILRDRGNPCLAGRQVARDCFVTSFLAMTICLYLTSFVYIFNKFVIGTLQSDITQAVEYRIGSFLSENINKNDKVFLSGTTSFWLNSWFDVGQLRGGRDPVANLPGWDKLAWEVREGSDPDKSIVQLKKFGIKYLVIHTGLSREYYHDFKYPDKFEAAGGIKKIFDDNGDRIYIME